VPAEAARLGRPVARRELRIVAVVLCACALAVVLAGARARGGAPPAGRGCVQADVAGVLGGGTVRGCGGRAASLCRAYAGVSASVAAQCRELRRRGG
jgi:hypothetical protein